jgi:hypothetical protein
MTPFRWQQIERLYQAVLEHPPLGALHFLPKHGGQIDDNQVGNLSRSKTICLPSGVMSKVRIVAGLDDEKPK